MNKKYKQIFLFLILLFIFIVANSFIVNFTYQIPKIIWVYWEDFTNVPDSIKEIIDYNKTTIHTWKVVLLSNKNINDYIPKDKFPKKYNDIFVQAQSDWIRLYLIYNYGGLWLDASIIVNDENKLDELRKISIEKNSDFTSFYLNSRFVENYTPSHIENSFIMAPKNSFFINRWKIEFEKAIDMGFHNYKKLLFSEGLNLNSIYSSEDDIYLTMHACGYKISREYIFLPNILLFKAEDGIYRLQNICDWNDKCIHDKLNNDNYVKKIPLIKLVSKNRENLNLSNYQVL